ncbi:MAG: PilZ domain-containing protein, partial [Bdellovibrionales bacterium]|nr:PilZ domain-containing protein [Bdellovibrionales bacterium]
MSPTVKKFITRSPRYVIDENDSNFLLFKNDKPGSENCRAEFIDISGTGVAFIVESDFAPNFGEVIKLDFEVPGYQKVSWWGRVVRINEYSEQKWWKQTQTYEDLVFVGVHFHNLPEGQKEAIEKALYDKFKKIKIQRRKEKKQAIKAWVKTYGKTILI